MRLGVTVTVLTYCCPRHVCAVSRVLITLITASIEVVLHHLAVGEVEGCAGERGGRHGSLEGVGEVARGGVDSGVCDGDDLPGPGEAQRGVGSRRRSAAGLGTLLDAASAKVEQLYSGDMNNSNRLHRLIVKVIVMLSTKHGHNNTC